MDSTNLSNYYEVNTVAKTFTDSKKFASLKGAMEYSRRMIDDNEINQLIITEYNNNEEIKVRTLVEDTDICDVDLAVGSIYTDRSNNQWQIAKVEGNKYIINIEDTTDNKIEKRIFEQMIGNELLPLQALNDSYVGNYLGRKIYKTTDSMYKAEDRGNKLLVSDNLEELKNAIKLSAESFKNDYLRQEIKDEKTDHTKGYSKRFYKELIKTLEENLDTLSETDITLDSDEEDDIKDNYNYQKNQVKRELREQIKKCSQKKRR